MLPIRILLKHTGLSAVLNLRIHMMNRTKVKIVDMLFIWFCFL